MRLGGILTKQDYIEACKGVPYVKNALVREGGFGLVQCIAIMDDMDYEDEQKRNNVLLSLAQLPNWMPIWIKLEYVLVGLSSVKHELGEGDKQLNQ